MLTEQWRLVPSELGSSAQQVNENKNAPLLEKICLFYLIINQPEKPKNYFL